jgi:hypothetical protein
MSDFAIYTICFTFLICFILWRRTLAITRRNQRQKSFRMAGTRREGRGGA